MKISLTSPMRNAECGMRNNNAAATATNSLRTPHSALRTASAFTMIEIALCLAIIGFALLSILLVLPSGMDTQRQTREETIIGQDASMLLEAIRNGAQGLDDLNNNVYAIVDTNAYPNIGWTNACSRLDEFQICKLSNGSQLG